MVTLWKIQMKSTPAAFVSTRLEREENIRTHPHQLFSSQSLVLRFRKRWHEPSLDRTNHQPTSNTTRQSVTPTLWFQYHTSMRLMKITVQEWCNSLLWPPKQPKGDIGSSVFGGEIHTIKQHEITFLEDLFARPKDIRKMHDGIVHISELYKCWHTVLGNAR